MKKQLLIALLLCISQPGLALAQFDGEDVYIKLGIGMAEVEADDATIGDLQDPPYDKIEFDSESSASYQFGLGYKIDNLFTLELALQYNAAVDLEGPYINNGSPLVDGSDGTVDLQTSAVMVSGQLDMVTLFDGDWKLRPYIGFGIGYAKNKLGKSTLDPQDQFYIEGNSENNFAWKVGLGATYPLSEHFALDLAYSYADYGEAESGLRASERDGDLVTLNSPLTLDVKTQEIFLSVRYLF